MYRRKIRSSSGSKMLTSGSESDRGSDIAAPNNTSLIVNRSKVSYDPLEGLPRSVTASLYEGDDEDSGPLNVARPSASILHSMSQKKQSTPQNRERRVLQPIQDNDGAIKAEVFSDPLRLLLSANTCSQPTSEPTGCIFIKTLHDCGASEIIGDGSFRLSQDQEVFSRKLGKKIKDEGLTEQFLDAFKNYIGNNNQLKKLIMLTQTSKDCDAARGPSQDSMLRIMLLVHCLQSHILKILLTKISEIIEASDSDPMDQAELISGILRQVRCLNRVENTTFACKLLEFLPVASALAKQEIVFLLPEIVTEDESVEVTTKLAELLQRGSELTPFIIDSLGKLTLTADLKAQVRENVLMRIVNVPHRFLPSLVNFIVNRSDPHDMNAVVDALRNHLPRNLEPDCSTKLFENFKKLFASLKDFTEAWIKAITNLTSPSDFNSFDLMALILIHGYVLNRKPSTLVLIRNRIRARILTPECFTQTSQLMKIVLLENHKEVLELASALLKSFDDTIAEMAISMFIDLFGVGDPFFQQEIVRDLVMHLTTGSSSSVQNSITLLLRLRSLHLEKLEPHAASLMSVLRILPDIELSMARQLMDLVASLVTAPALQDSNALEELNIFCRKQMSAWQPEVQRRGVMSVVTIVKYRALKAAELNNPDLSDADFLLKMAAGTQSESVTGRGFFFDELATVLLKTTSNVPFLMTWANRIYNQALNDVFIKDIELECNHFPMSLQYSIENSGNLVFPIVAFIVNPKPELYLNSETIPAALRLLWCAEKDVTRISPIMSASVVLPDASVFENFLSYDPKQQKMIMDCLFLCANFFIESINALSKQKTCEKLVIRLKQLIEVRKLIQQYAGQIPEYNPPPCQFHVPVSKQVFKKPATDGKKVSGRGKKRKSDGNDVIHNQSHLDSSALPCTSTAAPTEAVAQTPVDDVATVLNFNGSFRELHCHAYKLLRMDLKLNPSKVFKKKKMSDLIAVDVSWSYRPEDKPELGPSDTLFLLQDYLTKSDLILRERPCFLTKKPTGLVVESIEPHIFATGSVKLLPKLCRKLIVVSTYCKDLLEANLGVWDSPGFFPAAAADIKSCFSALLKIIAELLAWRGFQNPAHSAMLREVLLVLSMTGKNTQCSGTIASSQSAAFLALDAARFLTSLGSTIPQLSGGVYLTRAVQSCIRFTGSQDFSLVGELCSELLSRPWFTLTGAPDRGVTYNQLVDSIIRMHLACAENRLANIDRIAQLCREEVPKLLGKDSTLMTYEAFNKGNFPLLYRAMCEALVSATTEELAKHKSNDEECIEIWSTVTGVLMVLVEITKVHSSRTNLSALLKRSQAIIQLFLNKGLPLMESALRIKSDQVLKILKSLQAVTRFLHSVCCHSKLTSDGVVAAHVPKIRALCERLTLEVKGMLVLNKIPLDCITIAVLKNRDIQGNDIMSSQSVVDSDEESEIPAEVEEEDDDVIPMDDEDIPNDD